MDPSPAREREPIIPNVRSAEFEGWFVDPCAVDQERRGPPRAIAPSPAKITNALTATGTFSSLSVTTPSDTSPTFMACLSFCGIGTNSDAIPKINTTAPIQRIKVISLIYAERKHDIPCGCAAGDSVTRTDEDHPAGDRCIASEPERARALDVDALDRLPARSALKERELAEFSQTIDSSEPDSAPADILNRAIWHSVKGFDTPYNYGRPIRRQRLSSLDLLRLAGF